MDTSNIEYILATLQSKVEWYEGLIDFLDDNVPCLDELIKLYEESLEE